MGLIVDTSIFVAQERRGKHPSLTLRELLKSVGNWALSISVITIYERMHGVERARTSQQAERHQALVDMICQEIPVVPVTVEIARLTGRVEGALKANGKSIALDDLLIGATALHLILRLPRSTSNISLSFQI